MTKESELRKPEYEDLCHKPRVRADGNEFVVEMFRADKKVFFTVSKWSTQAEAEADLPRWLDGWEKAQVLIGNWHNQQKIRQA